MPSTAEKCAEPKNQNKGGGQSTAAFLFALTRPQNPPCMKKPLENLILIVRGQKVILDADLAEVYGVETRVFNQSVKRNVHRFPASN